MFVVWPQTREAGGGWGGGSDVFLLKLFLPAAVPMAL